MDEPARVRFGAHAVAAVAGRDLLGVLLDQGVPIAYVCMAGSCGTCRVRVLAGAEHLEAPTAAERRHFPAGGPAGEAADRGGLRLACQALLRATGDVVIVQD